MFINRISEQLKPFSHKMPYLNSFFKTEVTCIPKILRKCFGDYYNNSLSNGATWIFMLWSALHITFETCIDTILKKLRYREYVRIRLRSSLWYLGFYGTVSIYCGTKLFRNEIELFNFKKMHVPTSNNLPTQVILGYILISTYYLHTAFWEGLRNGMVVNVFRYLFLFLFMVSSFILRIVEISFSLTALISIAQVGLEFTRCAFMLSSQATVLAKLFLSSIFIAVFVVYTTVHVIIIPLTFVAPLGLKIMSDYPNALLIFLFFNLVAWLMVEIYQSVLSKVVDHWLYHMQQKEKSDSDSETERFDNHQNVQCALTECALFQVRNDFAYNIKILRKEINDRKNRNIAMRKPKNVFLQTLKCMVAMKRKLSERRLSGHFPLAEESDEKNEDSGNIVQSNLKKPENHIEERNIKMKEEECPPLHVKRSDEVLFMTNIETESDKTAESENEMLLFTSLDDANDVNDYDNHQNNDHVRNVNENRSGS
nr:uncharacterized protein LOC111504086 isoform X1 [Leptinotarsa decemlineata]